MKMTILAAVSMSVVLAVAYEEPVYTVTVAAGTNSLGDARLRRPLFAGTWRLCAGGSDGWDRRAARLQWHKGMASRKEDGRGQGNACAGSVLR